METVSVFIIWILGLTSVHAASTSFCKIYEWACDDDTCIDSKLKCNGVADCQDGSDETFVLCRNTDCPGFSCVYGGCVPSNATCNGVKDCRDNSDELLLECRNEIIYTECLRLIPVEAPDYTERKKECDLKAKTCENGQLLEDFTLCDGKVDCDDGSDETVRTCATHNNNCRGDTFRCHYGGCVDSTKFCDDIIDCADGSDELKGLCSKTDDDDSEWRCDNGARIKAKFKCNGALDCPDGSDETFPLCWDNKCPAGFSKCVYGGCVKNGVFCDGKKDCADNSDELLPSCRNETTYKECFNAIGSFFTPNFREKMYECQTKDKTCKNGQLLNIFPKCNGKVDCSDGSDETLETCAIDLHDCRNIYGYDERTKFRCRYGACVDQSKICNGVNDCADGSDELQELCHKSENDNKFWTCEDETRISASGKCNGSVECPDGSDETFLLCRKNVCPLGFRCVYGGCVNNSAICNGVKDCADNSDELLLKCRNEPTFMTCFNQFTQKIPAEQEKRIEQLAICKNIEKMCKNGHVLEDKKQKCDGKVDCEDGSDETLETCATDRQKCSNNNYFRCQDGGCVDPSKVCNKVNDCADGSDELDGLCYKGKCVLPSYPKNGNYSVLEKPTFHPGQVVDSALLIFSCFSGYKLYGTSQYVNCLKGAWPYDPPKCLSQCTLKKDATINFWCLPRGPLSTQVEHECGDLVPDGATIRPVCSKSIYHFATGVLDFMHCVDGKWDRDVPTCSPHCGLVTQQANHLIVNATSAKRGELPWHAGIYDKRKTPFEQICGGTLVTNTMVISAAHCFWTDIEKQLPAEYYAVALGKLYRPWNDKHEIGDQKSDVREIKIPPRYKGSEASFQEDIALVILATPAVYRSYVLPACVDFGYDLELKQLAPGSKGKVSGWGLTSQDGKESQVLKVAELPYLDIDRCFAEAPPSFSKFITGDKFCVENANSSALCKGDSGGGLVFPSVEENGQLRYFLRGLVSTAPRNDHKCNTFAHTTFTKISKHEEFILQYWN